MPRITANRDSLSAQLGSGYRKLSPKPVQDVSLQLAMERALWSISVAARSHTSVQWLMSKLQSQQAGAHEIPRLVQDALDNLVEREQYEAFAELFDAYNVFMASNAENQELLRAHNGLDSHGQDLDRPFQTQLCLRLPSDWKPSQTAALEAALSRISVQRLMVAPPVGDINPILSEGACSCVVALLKGGTAELVIGGAFSNAKAVALEFKDSRLTSIKFWAPLMVSDEQLPAYLEAQSTLIDGLAGCVQLKHLEIGDRCLLGLHESLAKFAAKGGKGLDSLSLTLSDLGATGKSEAEKLRPILEAFKGCSALKSIDVQARLTDVAGFESAIAEPFAGHPNLSRLAIFSYGEYVDTRHLHAFPVVAEFMASCPRLTDFAWALTGLYGTETALNTLAQPLPPDGLTRLEKALVVLKDRLRSFTFRGFVTPQNFQKAWFKATGEFSALRKYDVSGSMTDAEATQDALAALKKNPVIEEAVFSAEYGHYYLTSNDGRRYGFSNDYRSAGEARSFQLASGPRYPPVNAAARATFEGLRSHLNAFHDELASHRRQVLLPGVREELHPRVAAFMNAALISNAPGHRDDTGQFGLPGMAALNALADDSQMVNAVQLARVNRATAGFAPQPKDDVPASSESREGGGAHKLPTPSSADLKEMVRLEGSRVHQKLMKAVKNDNVDEVRLLLKEGVIDGGGRARKAAKTNAMRAVFAEFDPPTDRFTRQSQTSTTTTTTTATTTTTTTTGTAPAGNAEPSSPRLLDYDPDLD